MDAHLPSHTLKTTRGLTYRYYATPTSTVSKHTLLLLHGFPDGADLWQFLIPHLLPTNLRIIAPDLLGYGGTSKPAEPEAYEWRAQSQDLLDILAAEGVEGNVISLGHDWGAALAQAFHALHKRIHSGLITLAVAVQPSSGQPFDLAQVNKFTEQTVGYPLFEYWNLFLPASGVALMESHLESVWDAMHGRSEGKTWMREMFCTPGAFEKFLQEGRRVPVKPYAEDDKPLRAAWLKSIREGGLTAPTNWYRATAQNIQQAAEPEMDRKVDVPYLFIGCDGDAVCLTGVIELAKQAGIVPDLTFHEVKSGHWCTYEVPDEVGGLIVKFLGEKGFVG